MQQDTIIFDSVSRMSRNADEGIETYKPSMSKLQSYKDTLNRGKRLLDPDLQHYDSALQMVADCQDFLLLVVNYRRRSGCIVM